jgi:copper(I)-binding protein
LAISAPVLMASLCGARAGDIAVSDAWIRALPRAVPSGGYFTLHNGGTTTLTLTGAQSPACGMLMLHKSESHGGMGSMQSVAAVEVPAGGTLKFAPGGYHLMCMEAKAAIAPGNHVPVTLLFQGGGHVTAQFAVRNASGK